MSDNTIKLLHRLIVPILHTIIWTIGILACFQLFFNNWSFLHKLVNGPIFLGIITIYFVYLLEFVLNLMDTALVNNRFKLKSSLLYFVVWFVVNIGLTFWLSLSFINKSLLSASDPSSKNILYWIVATAVSLKLTDLLFSKNTEIFMHSTSECSIISRDV